MVKIVIWLKRSLNELYEVVLVSCRSRWEKKANVSYNMLSLII